MEKVSEFRYLALIFTNKELIGFTGLHSSEASEKFFEMRQVSS